MCGDQQLCGLEKVLSALFCPFGFRRCPKIRRASCDAFAVLSCTRRCRKHRGWKAELSEVGFTALRSAWIEGDRKAGVSSGSKLQGEMAEKRHPEEPAG